jgi:hypothetical protein
LYGGNPVLLPAPQKITWGNSKFPLSDANLLLPKDLPVNEYNNVIRFAGYVQKLTGKSLNTVYNEASGKPCIFLSSDHTAPALPVPGEKAGSGSRESYHIKVTANKAQITAKSDAAMFYALQTLRQLIMVDGKNSYIPEVEIEDYPAFPYRGVMMDFSHGGLLTEQEIKNQIDFLSGWKMNQYYFYNEVSIEMKGYPLINYNACYSQEQISRIIAYGKEKHMDVIPFVNFYGHLHELLRIEKYSGLGIGRYGHDLDPRDPGVQILLKDWIKQYADLFPTPFIHVGFDETWETERMTIEDHSIKPRALYLDQLNFVANTLREYGKTVMVWTDISNNYPDIISEFPRDIIPVIWEYSEKPASFARWFKPIQKEKLPFFVQSAVDSWGNVYPAAEYTMNNIDLCLKACREEKAIGYITSVWTDAVQPLLRNTWLFMAYGSVGAWQKDNPDRGTFIDDYCRIMYPGAAVAFSTGYKKMAEAESFLAKCLGRHTLSEMWADPFSEYHLKHTREHLDDYKKARLAAGDAQEAFYEALKSGTTDPSFIHTMLLNSRLLDFTAARFIWARTMVDRWNWIYNLDPGTKKDNLRSYDLNYSTHGMTVDMMDYCTELKEEYRNAWLAENMPYRMGTILGRFDTEYLIWRNMYTRLRDYGNRNNINNSKDRFEDLFLKK